MQKQAETKRDSKYRCFEGFQYYERLSKRSVRPGEACGWQHMACQPGPAAMPVSAPGCRRLENLMGVLWEGGWNKINCSWAVLVPGGGARARLYPLIMAQAQVELNSTCQNTTCLLLTYCSCIYFSKIQITKWNLFCEWTTQCVFGLVPNDRKVPQLLWWRLSVRHGHALSPPAPLFSRSALAGSSPLFSDVFVYTCNQNHRICRTGFYASSINIKFQKIKTNVNIWYLHAHCICIG